MPIAKNNLPRYKVAVQAEVERMLAGAAHAVEAQAKVLSPYRTGFLRGSIGAHQVGTFVWQVVASAHYAIYVELGTRHMGAQPYLVPALRRVWPKFVANLRTLSR